MKRVILGTAGHIDHGKTTLIKALTGVDCDRLKEEKERGITIELGFTSVELPSGQRAGIIDVPGHEKFVKNMVAGVQGIDAVMLVIAADEGVMPQTREHLDICRILSIKKGLIVLTKSDLVDGEWIKLVTEDVNACVKGTFLEGAPLVPVSSTDGRGMDRLGAVLEEIVAGIEERPASGIFRLPVDRVFSMKGFGTVVTGTLVAGRIAVGDEVEVLPEKIKTKIRGIQVHNAGAESATAGMRTALNFQGIEKSAIKRGDVVAPPDTLIPSSRVTAWFDQLESSPALLKNRARARFHAGTSEMVCRVILLSSEELPPGQGGFVQLVFETPAVVLPHDRYVLRGYSPVYTLGGGEILDNHPPRHKRFSEQTLKHLEILKNGDIREVLLLLCREAGPRGLEFHEMQARSGLEAGALQAHLDALLAGGDMVAFNTKPLQVTLPDIVRSLEHNITGQLKAYHARNPLKPGLLREELKTKLPRGTQPRLYTHVVDGLTRSGNVTLTREFLSLPEYKPVLKDSQKDLKQKIYELYQNGGSAPPTRRELIEQLKITEKEAGGILDLLVREGALKKLNDDIFYEASALHAIIQTAIAHMKKSGDLNIQSLKELTGLSRKFLIPLFEYMDKSRITLRLGDKRVLRKKEE